MEETPEVQDELGEGGKFKDWLQDNIRIILSVLIVVAIAAGIYSYSKRAEVPTEPEELALEEALELEEGEEAVTIIGDEDMDEDEMEAEEEEMTEAVELVQEPVEEVRINQPEETVSISEETGEAFVETAIRGDSLTTLARKATRDYLEKNSDSSLTAEHKIYIEDYLRKNVGHVGGVSTGDQVSFSKILIKDAIEMAKTLSPNQLKNLEKYSARVSVI
jgi:hypothetical protein